MSVRSFVGFRVALLTMAFGACAAALGSGCGDDGDGGVGGAVANKLQQCDLATQGHVSIDDRETSQCVGKCFADATCAELEAALCKQRPSARLMDCESACFAPKDCADGKGRYSVRERCDGREDCADGSDESGCSSVPMGNDDAPEYCAKSGARIFDFQRCDGVDDCGDGTDEKGCSGQPARFTCKRGFGNIVRQIPMEKVCDLFQDCPDGSDESAEQGCAQIMCNAPSGKR